MSETTVKTPTLEETAAAKRASGLARLLSLDLLKARGVSLPREVECLKVALEHRTYPDSPGDTLSISVTNLEGGPGVDLEAPEGLGYDVTFDVGGIGRHQDFVNEDGRHGSRDPNHMAYGSTLRQLATALQSFQSRPSSEMFVELDLRL